MGDATTTPVRWPSMSVLRCTRCLIARQSVDWYDDPAEGPPDLTDYGHKLTDPGVIVIYAGEGLCVFHWNEARGYPPHGLGPHGLPEEIEEWEAAHRERVCQLAEIELRFLTGTMSYPVDDDEVWAGLIDEFAANNDALEKAGGTRWGVPERVVPREPRWPWLRRGPVRPGRTPG